MPEEPGESGWLVESASPTGLLVLVRSPAAETPERRAYQISFNGDIPFVSRDLVAERELAEPGWTSSSPGGL